MYHFVGLSVAPLAPLAVSFSAYWDRRRRIYNLVDIQVSWTHALRQIVKNCYTHHEREDLLPTFDENLDANVPSDDRFREGVLISAGGFGINCCANY